jgi:hypothetical protein
MLLYLRDHRVWMTPPLTLASPAVFVGAAGERQQFDQTGWSPPGGRECDECAEGER